MRWLDWIAGRRQRYTIRLQEALLTLFSQNEVFSGENAREFAGDSAEIVREAQRQLADTVAVGLTGYLRDSENIPDGVPELDDDEITDLRGVPSEVVYRRPFVEIWDGLRKAPDDDFAIGAARRRLEVISDSDMQLTYVHSAQKTMQRQPEEFQPRYWRRVPKGEFTCALCLVASTQRYSTKRLSPIHPACDCAVEPIRSLPPGDSRVIDEELLERVHARVEKELGWTDRSATGYERLLVRITEEHGELGEILVRPAKPRS